jgi:pantothenate synthetase
VRRQSDLQVPEDVVEQSLVVLAASRLGAARLIDNVEIVLASGH